jgi:hypothetical protein
MCSEVTGRTMCSEVTGGTMCSEVTGRTITEVMVVVTPPGLVVGIRISHVVSGGTGRPVLWM